MLYRWNDLWLNEGFATYAEHVGTDSIRPEWRMVSIIILNERSFFFIITPSLS